MGHSCPESFGHEQLQCVYCCSVSLSLKIYSIYHNPPIGRQDLSQSGVCEGPVALSRHKSQKSPGWSEEEPWRES